MSSIDIQAMHFETLSEEDIYELNKLDITAWLKDDLEHKASFSDAEVTDYYLRLRAFLRRVLLGYKKFGFEMELAIMAGQLLANDAFRDDIISLGRKKARFENIIDNKRITLSLTCHVRNVLQEMIVKVAKDMKSDDADAIKTKPFLQWLTWNQALRNTSAMIEKLHERMEFDKQRFKMSPSTSNQINDASSQLDSDSGSDSD
ncbi:hypothetical protein K461DRAFT_320618 [Myriangium duriaei CBS 260.36]|uniref:Uncharacterized protein n=1 Tax=Myriangium duriaei CBS 260.36 TaxID=1168546 RepID=A0A9P4IZQ6_9PEZI|nr:hypothetical protein K461DRAFT_320618 [Myriangium duriaei CBS 260.36]